MIRTMTVLPENMRKAAGRGFINATDCADYLTKQGVPFRDAYTTVGKLVFYCTETGKTLEELTLEELVKFDKHFGPDIFVALNMETCAQMRRSYGGPAKEETTRQIEAVKRFVAQRRNV